MEFIIPIAAVILIVAFVAYLQRGQQKISCPQCDSAQIRNVEQQLTELKQDQTMGYAVKLDVQLIMKTTYRCQTCNHTWTVTAPER
jgi:transposase-like protein